MRPETDSRNTKGAGSPDAWTHQNEEKALYASQAFPKTKQSEQNDAAGG